MKKKLVFTVGNGMMGDDAAGPMLARMLQESPVDGWDVIDGGNAPENHLFRIRELGPDEVLIVDSADMDLHPGQIRHIDEDAIGSLFLMTTHSLPLNFLMDAIQEFVPHVALIGIQPGTVAFGYPVSEDVVRAVERVYVWLRGGPELNGALQLS